MKTVTTIGLASELCLLENFTKLSMRKGNKGIFTTFSNLHNIMWPNRFYFFAKKKEPPSMKELAETIILCQPKFFAVPSYEMSKAGIFIHLISIGFPVIRPTKCDYS